MGNMNGKVCSAIDCLMEYRNNRDKYLPLIDHETSLFRRVTETDDINIGWDCGFIGNRPYFIECWSPGGMTMITVFISTIGIEDYSIPELEKLLIEDAGIYSKKEGYFSPTLVPKFCDSNGNEFFSINILVGMDDEDAVIEGGGYLTSFRDLNKLNVGDGVSGPFPFTPESI